MVVRRQGVKDAASRPSATSLPESADADQARRMRGYLISMGIRTVCFLGAVATWGLNRWVSLVFFVFAGILPYVAVVFANATGKRRIDQLGAVTPGPLPRQELHGSARDPQ